MGIYLLSNNTAYSDYWKSCIKNSKNILSEKISNLQRSDILIVGYALYVKGLHTDAKLIVFDAEPTFSKCMQLLENSVKAYGNVYMHTSHILSAIESVKDGKIWIYPNFLSMMISNSKQSNQEELEEKIAQLTQREKEIAKLILNGLTNKEIAIKLEISTNTVKIHTKNIYTKLNVTDRLSLFSFLTA